MRIIHSSDLQIGMVFNYFEPDVAAMLQDARQAAVHTLGERAREHRAAAVLLAGDIYDKQQLSPQTLAKPIEAMRRFPGVEWHLLPGNHDHVRENGLWDRLRRQGLPQNVHAHTDHGAVKIAEEDGTEVFLLPAPFRYRSSDEDLTAYMDNAATPEGAIRIGMAHGSIQKFGSEGEAKNYIAPDRAENRGSRLSGARRLAPTNANQRSHLVFGHARARPVQVAARYCGDVVQWRRGTPRGHCRAAGRAGGDASGNRQIQMAPGFGDADRRVADRFAGGEAAWFGSGPE